MNTPTARREARWRAVFLAVVLAVGTTYTVIAFGLQWRTNTGQIGPGFFPAVMGVGIMIFSAAALAHALTQVRRYEPERAASVPPSAEEVEAPAAPSVATTLLVGVLMAGFLITLIPLGAIIAGMLFMLATLAVLNPGRWVANIIFSLALPIALYLLFQVLLDAGLPPGVLPV